MGTIGQLHSFLHYHLTRLRRLGAVSATALGFQHCCAADGRAQIANSVFSPMSGSSYVRTLPSLLLLSSKRPCSCKTKYIVCLPWGKKRPHWRQCSMGPALQLALCGYLQWQPCGLHHETSENLFWILPSSRDRVVQAGLLHSTAQPPSSTASSPLNHQDKTMHSSTSYRTLQCQ